MHVSLKKFIVLLLIPLLISCSGVNFSVWHFPYMMPVSQGNVITEKEFSQLKLGMTKEDASFVVGTPMTQFLFDQKRWDFVYQMYENNKLKKSYDVVVLFDNNNKIKYINKSGELFNK